MEELPTVHFSGTKNMHHGALGLIKGILRRWFRVEILMNQWPWPCLKWLAWSSLPISNVTNTRQGSIFNVLEFLFNILEFPISSAEHLMSLPSLPIGWLCWECFWFAYTEWLSFDARQSVVMKHPWQQPLLHGNGHFSMATATAFWSSGVAINMCHLN